MQVRARLESDFNILQKRKLSPELAINEKNKEERESRIKRFYRIFNEQVKQGKDKINKKNFKNYQERYVNFVREARKDPNTRWIYESYNYDINRNTHEVKPYYIKTNYEKQKTYRQKVYIKTLRSRELFIIQKSFENPTQRSKNILKDIYILFDSIDLNSKIKFNYNFSKFIEKCKSMKEFILSLIKFFEPVRFQPIQKLKELFVNNKIINDIIKGEKDFNDIFLPEIYYFLLSNNIINDSLIFEYKLQFTHRYRNLAELRLKELVNLYVEKINILFYLLFDSDFLQNPNEQKLNDFFINQLIKPYIVKYLFYINFSLKYFYNQKNKLFEIAFEDFYYYELKQNLYFLQKFLKCENKIFSVEPIQSGAYGEIYNDTNNNLKIIKKPKNPILEKLFFEFFKHCCIFSKFNSSINLSKVIPEVFEFILGENEVYIKMEKIVGKTVLDYFVEYVDCIYSEITNNKNIDQIKIFEKKKYIKMKNILLAVADLAKKFQSINFIHYDYHLKNILITSNIKDTNLELKLIDFDYSIVEYQNLFIFNLAREFDYQNIFMNNDTLSNFIKSIDLFRFIIYIFIFPSYIKKNQNKYQISGEFLNYLREKLYGTNNIIIPNNIDVFFKEIPSLNRYIGKSERALVSNLFFIRKKIFDQFAINNRNNREWISKNKNWIEQFLPNNFIDIINSYNLNQSNIILSGGKKK